MPSRLVAMASALLVLSSAALAEGPGIGRVATPDEIASWDISIGPDGAGLPPGRGTPKQGEMVYAEKCVACHGEKGAGKPNDQLVGGRGSLSGDQAPVKTVGSFWPYATTLFDYIRRAMPLNEAKSLTRFRVAWRWNGGPAILQSRATDESGYVQPTRALLIAERGMKTIYHFNGIASWAVGENGEVTHVYA